jgi:hypothetical protein
LIEISQLWQQKFGGTHFVGSKALVAVDIDHIKRYVFGTDKLREIRGASSRLDRFNREKMKDRAESLDAEAHCVFANGGSGLFLIDAGKADEFIAEIKRVCKEETGDTASVICVKQALPANAPETVEEILTFDLKDTLALLRYRLREAKGCPPDILGLASHPFLRPCESCGVRYAEPMDKDTKVPESEDEADALSCRSCQLKRREDWGVKKYISGTDKTTRSPLWTDLLDILQNRGYLLEGVGRPQDLNVFQGGSKSYIGLIYADANGMGQIIEKLPTLRKLEKFADKINKAIYQAVGEAIAEHLSIETFKMVNPDGGSAFPFDIFLLGGDDVVMVTPASVALQVAQTIATRFYEHANADKDKDEEECTLSVGVVLAPSKYPFGLLLELAEETLKFAKREGSRTEALEQGEYGKTRINFMVVTGSISQGYKRMYASLRQKDNEQHVEPTFYATLRPFTIEQLDFLLKMIREGKHLGLGRTKLHQLRQAVLQKNLSTAVSDSRTILVSWKSKQREFVVKKLYALAALYQQPRHNPDDPASMSIKVPFPWFADGKEDGRIRYRTMLLDLVELYDFVAGKEDDQRGTEQD